MTGRWIDPWPPLPPDAWLRGREEKLPFPLGADGCRLYALARHGLWHGVRALGVQPGDEVLVPAYHHGSEVETLVRLGLRVAFYGGDARLAPDESELDALAGPRTRALHLVHYLGFPQELQRWRSFCDARGWRLFEDAAQSWLATCDGAAVGTVGDLAIFSLYKTFGLPDGAALLCAAALPESTGADGHRGIGAVAELHARWMAQRLPVHRRTVPDPASYDAAADFALGNPGSCPSRLTAALLPRVVDVGAPAARRAHYRMLLDALSDRVPPPFAELPDGASPWMFPVQVADKDDVAERLARAGIGAVKLWSIPHPSLDVGRFPDAARRRDTTIGLPVHQELRPAELERITAAFGRSKPRPAMRVEAVSSLDAARREWEALSLENGNVFMTFEWVSACWRLDRGDGRLLLAACRRADGRTAGLLPLVAYRENGLRVVRLLGHGPADRLAPLCAPGDREMVARAMRTFLLNSRNDLFVGDQMPAEEGWAASLGATVVEREASPVLGIRGLAWDEFLARRSANFRQQVRRRERRLLSRGDVRFRLTDDPARLHTDLDTLIELHGARWNMGGSTAFTGTRRALHHDFAARALERGWLRLWMLEIDGSPVAAWYGFRFGAAEWFYQSGRDPSAADDAVGFVLLCHTIREAMNDGMSEYRFLRGDESYKGRFADRDPGLESVALALSVRGRAALASRRARPVAGRALRRVRARPASAR